MHQGQCGLQPPCRQFKHNKEPLFYVLLCIITPATPPPKWLHDHCSHYDQSDDATFVAAAFLSAASAGFLLLTKTSRFPHDYSVTRMRQQVGRPGQEQQAVAPRGVAHGKRLIPQHPGQPQHCHVPEPDLRQSFLPPQRPGILHPPQHGQPPARLPDGQRVVRHRPCWNTQAYYCHDLDRLIQ